MSHLANHLSFLPSNEQVSSLAVASPFAYQIWQQDKAQVEAFLGQYPFDKRLDRALIDALVVQFCAYDKAANADVQEASVAKGLRVLRKLLMVRWIWQDALHLADVVSLTAELSEFANSAICFAKEFVYDGLIQRYGEPMVAAKIPKKDEFAIIAMGKLGAGELNLSSDIDLIFVHKGQGDTDISKVGKKSIDTQKFMLNLGRGVIRLLDDNNEHGFVFRVDMRLRPWGDGSPLVMTLQALAKYFDHHGRTWERFAWLKARVVNPVSGAFLEEITTLARTFVFRYYVDYSAFSALREMRTLISNQVAQREDLDNVKLGVGGIRDIEFIAQAFALIYGGHYVVLMERTACLEALDTLCKLGIIEKSTCEDLTSAYQFLRRLEHAIQARHDTQSQRLPVGDELFAIAQALGFASVDELRTVLDTHRAKVSLPFDKLVTARQSLQEDSVIDADKEVTAMAAWLDEPNAERLQAFWSSRLINNLSEEAKNRLMQAYPMIIHALNSHQHNTNLGNVALPRLLDLLEAICRRSIYLVMLSENPNATLNLIPMLSASPWIARELALYPVLLDTLLQKRYQHLPDKAELQAILAQNLLSVTPFDDESYLNAIRLFKKTQVLAVATSDVLDHHPIMKVSDSLTFISEVVLESCLMRAFDELVVKHGYPLDLQGERLTREACGFAVIGYGKLGGIEMSYASDLDVVFLHRVSEQAMTDGEKHPISGMKFATRLVQKLITYLTTQTRDGRAYELDMRLRPSGNAGVMVVSINAFEHYQKDKAWAWEHQALVRARGICGDRAVIDYFDLVRLSVLTTKRQLCDIKAEVLEMREKMKTHLSQHQQDKFHLKQDTGGLVDIEFMAQFAVLGFAHQYPELAKWSDNVRIFETVAQTNLWSGEVCQTLTQAYLDIRKATHIQALNEQKSVVDNAPWQAVRQKVQAIWQQVFELPSK